MSNFSRLFLLLATSVVLFSCSAKHKIAIVSESPSAETDSLAALLVKQGFDTDVIGISDSFDGYDVVWYHRSDTSDMTAAETEAGAKVTRYLKKGGRLILSMEAVRLLNTWGIDESPVEVSTTEAVDDGFGRKVGFHGFRSHPLFDKMFGGAYVWHGYQDNKNRVLGYFDDSMPGRPDTKIVATAWEYILYQPNSKVIWEETVGDGKVMAIGAFLYYSRPNVHKAILDQFTENLVNYMLGKPSESKERYWTYEPADILFDGAIDSPKAIKSKPASWHLAEDTDALTFPATREELTLPSRRAMLVSEERGGIKEIWTHPVMSLKNYKVTAFAGDSTAVLNNPAEDVEFRFNSIIRKYAVGNNAKVTEILTVDHDKPVTVAHYEWTGDLDSLVVSFSSNMRYMWPYDENALGSLHCGWSEYSNLYAVRDGEGEFVSLVGSDLQAHLLSESRYNDFVQVDASFSIPVKGEDVCNVVMVAGNEGPEMAAADYKKVIINPESVFTTSADYYRKYLAETAVVETPDEIFNKGYRWATASAGQFLAETPGLGAALMAGYSSSLRGWGGGHRVSGRPGYAWYFGRDSELAAFAYLSMGDFEAVKSTLKLLADFQGVNGTIFHELTTSGSDHFDASDSTPLFVVLVYEYLKATGDIDFVKKMMPHVYKAMSFCLTTDTDGDHLIEIEHVGHGWLEGGDYFTGRTEFYLSAIWLRALRGAADMAEMFGNGATAASYRAESGLVEESLAKFWNPEKGYYNYGINYDLSYSTAQLALASVPVWLGVTDPDKAYQHVCKYAADNFSDDWGVRQTNDPRPEDQVGAYDESNIWPLFTGSVSLAEYYVGRYNQGFDHMMASLLCYRSATHGRVPEVLRGNSYRSGGITRDQCWSETAVTGPAIQGMVGFKASALDHKSEIAPRLPFDWKTFSVKNLRSGKVTMAMDVEKADGQIEYKLSSDGRQSIGFSPAFPPATEIKSVKVNGAPVEYSVTELPEYTVVHTSFDLKGKATVTIEMKEGMSVLPSYREAEDKGQSLGIRIMSQKSENGVLSVTVQGKPGTDADLNIYKDGRKQTETISFGDEIEKTVEIE